MIGYQSSAAIPGCRCASLEALGVGSLTAGLQQVEQRAIAASRGKMSTVRSHNVIKSEIVRGGMRAIAGGAAR